MSLFVKLLFCSCLIGVTYGRTEEEIRAWFLSLGVECNKEYEISAEDMTLLSQHKIPENANAKCLLACVYKTANWLNSNGMFDLDGAMAFAQKEYVDDTEKLENSKKLAEICKTVNDAKVSDGEKGCERSILLLNCLMSNGPKLGFDMI